MRKIAVKINVSPIQNILQMSLLKLLHSCDKGTSINHVDSWGRRGVGKITILLPYLIKVTTNRERGQNTQKTSFQIQSTLEIDTFKVNFYFLDIEITIASLG